MENHLISKILESNSTAPVNKLFKVCRLQVFNLKIYFTNQKQRQTQHNFWNNQTPIDIHFTLLYIFITGFDFQSIQIQLKKISCRMMVIFFPQIPTQVQKWPISTNKAQIKVFCAQISQNKVQTIQSCKNLLRNNPSKYKKLKKWKNRDKKQPELHKSITLMSNRPESISSYDNQSCDLILITKYIIDRKLKVQGKIITIPINNYPNTCAQKLIKNLTWLDKLT